MGSLTQGVQAGISNYFRSKELEELKTLRDRQALIQQLGALKDVRELPPGKIRAQAIDEILRPLGVPESTRSAISKANDEEYDTLGGMVQRVVAANPSVGATNLQDLFKSGHLRIADIVKMSGEIDKQETAARSAKLRGGIASGVGGGGGMQIQAAPLAPGTSFSTLAPDEGAALDLRPPVAPVVAPSPGAVPTGPRTPEQQLDALESLDTELSGRVDRLMALGEGVTPNEVAGLKFQRDAIQIRRARLEAQIKDANPELKETTLSDASGVDTRYLYDPRRPPEKGGPLIRLGAAPVKEAQPGTEQERLARAEENARANPNDPKAQRELREAQRAWALKEKAITMGRVAPEPKPPSESERLFFSKSETDVDALDTLLTQVRDPKINAVLGMSPDAWIARKAGKFYGPALTQEQNEYLANLAKQASQLRTSLAGQAQTVPEMRNLIPLIPKESDPPSVQIAKMTAIRNGMVAAYNNKRRDLLQYGMQGPQRQFGPPPSRPKPPSAADADAAAKRLGIQ